MYVEIKGCASDGLYNSSFFFSFNLIQERKIAFYWFFWLLNSLAAWILFFMEIPLVKFFMCNFCAKMLHLVHIPFILSRVNEFQKHLKWLFVFGLK